MFSVPPSSHTLARSPLTKAKGGGRARTVSLMTDNAVSVSVERSVRRTVDQMIAGDVA
jgi:hypothetical protein